MAKVKKKQAIPLTQDYRQLQLTASQRIQAVAAAGILGMALLYIFYQNTIIAILGLLMGALGPAYYRRRLIRARAQALNTQFKDFLHALSSSVSAGKSLQNAMHDAYENLGNLYYDENTLILVELRRMINQIGMNMKVHEAISQLAERSHDADILSFSNVLQSIESVSQSALPRLIKRTANIISEKIEVKQEIETGVASMKVEQKIMAAMPVFLMLIINLAAPDYMAPLYASPMGYIVITIAIAMLLGAIWISSKIMDIKV